MALVKCVLCKKSFSTSSAVRQHFVDDHNVPENDEVLNRYVQLFFSSNTGYVARKQKVLVRLLKLLKRRVSHNTINREKVKLHQTQVEKIIYDFINLNDDVNSVDSGVNNYDQSCWTKLSNVKWFLKYFDVYINKSVSTDENNGTVSFFSSEEREFSKCARLKIEQKSNVTKICRVSKMQTLMSVSIKCREFYIVIFLKTSPTIWRVQLPIKMTVDFVKSESSELEESWENEGNFYSGDGVTQCVEQRNINEYSSFASGSIVL